MSDNQFPDPPVTARECPGIPYRDGAHKTCPVCRARILPHESERHYIYTVTKIKPWIDDQRLIKRGTAAVPEPSKT